jgi:hypothetical protein
MKSWIPLTIVSLIMISGERFVTTNNKSFNMENNTYPVRLINVSINKPASDVYRFASNPENFPKWMDFVRSIKKDGDIWIGETNLGPFRFKMVPKNEFGIIDHHVTIPNGDVVFNPMRVIENNKGSEFIFTLFRMPGRSDKEFEEDFQAVTKDLNKLKTVMEAQ